MSEGSNLVVLVSSDNSYLMTALMDKMALKRIRTVNSKSEISAISSIKEKIDAFMIYANTAMVDEDILVYVRDKADEEDIPVILIGDDYFIAEIEKIINEHFIDNI